MIIIKSTLPKRSSGQIIQIRTAASIAESGFCQADIPFQNKGKMIFLFPGQRSHSHCSGNISGSLPVLAAGIQQEKKPSGRISVSDSSVGL